MRISSALVGLFLAGCNTQVADSPSAHAAKKDKAPAITDATDPAMVVGKWDGGQVTYGELYEDVKGALVKAEVEYLTAKYQTEAQALESKMVEGLLKAEAAKRGLEGPEALLALEIEAKVTAPTEEEIKAFYEVMKRQMRGASYEEVHDRVAVEVMRRKQTELFQSYIEGLRESYNATMELPFPNLPRIDVSVDDDPSIGPEDAKVTIVQFAEYQCPYCGTANATVEEVIAKYDGKIRMVFRDFPLSFHPRAIPAAVAANCAGEQGKYWEMHKALMLDQRSLEDEDLTRQATLLELDLAKWNTCRADPAQAAEVQHDFEDGQAAGVSGTPAFFINGLMISGAQPFSEFERIIEQELAAEG
jgi:protein-disulfide isomerase